MKLNLPSADALLTASAAGSALLAGGFALLPQELHESAWKAETAYSKDSHRHLYEGLAASAGGGAIIGAVALGDDSKAAKARVRGRAPRLAVAPAVCGRDLGAWAALTRVPLCLARARSCAR